MITEKGSIWDWHSEKRHIVITTNIGWKKDGTNPMGAGVAKIAATHYPDLPKWYGNKCKRYGENTAVAYYEDGGLFLFPTKPLDIECPWMSWKSDSSLELIAKSSRQLVALVDVLSGRGRFIKRIGLPLPGCGNGNLTRRQVFPIISSILDDRFVLLE